MQYNSVNTFRTLLKHFEHSFNTKLSGVDISYPKKIRSIILDKMMNESLKVHIWHEFEVYEASFAWQPFSHFLQHLKNCVLLFPWCFYSDRKFEEFLTCQRRWQDSAEMWHLQSRIAWWPYNRASKKMLQTLVILNEDQPCKITQQVINYCVGIAISMLCPAWFNFKHSLCQKYMTNISLGFGGSSTGGNSDDGPNVV